MRGPQNGRWSQHFEVEERVVKRGLDFKELCSCWRLAFPPDVCRRLRVYSWSGLSLVESALVCRKAGIGGLYPDWRIGVAGTTCRVGELIEKNGMACINSCDALLLTLFSYV